MAREWISVKERLPEEEQDVLVFGDGIDLARYRPDQTEYRFDCDTYGLSLEEVTHWMPLPEPPK